MNLQPLILLALPALAAIWSIATIIRGRRSRVAGDHPLCRACGYDLFGRPPDSFRCSECGADLRRHSAIATRGQLRRPELIRRGRRFLLASMLLLSAACWYEARGVNWQHHKPVFWLLHDTKVEKNRDVAFAELLRRLQAGELSQPQLDSIIDRALAAQADLSQPWDGRWGDLVERARGLNRTSNDRWSRYVNQAWHWRLETRPRARRADVLPVQFSSRHRVAGQTVLSLDGQSSFDLTDRFGRIISHPGNPIWALNGGTRIEWSARDLANLADGPVVARAVLAGVTIDPTSGVAVRVPYADQVEARSLLLDNDTPSVNLVCDPQRRAQAKADLRNPRLTIQTSPPQRTIFAVDVAEPTIDFYYQVWLSSGSRTVQLGSISYIRHGASGATDSTWAVLQGQSTIEDVGHLDVILRPDPSKAARTLDGFEIWGEEIVLKDVPVRRIP